MAILHVRNVPKYMYQRLRRLASARNRSLGAEVILLLQEALRQEQARRGQTQLLANIRRGRYVYHRKLRVADSVALLREDRER